MEDVASKVGLHMNTDKTEVMMYNQGVIRLRLLLTLTILAQLESSMKDDKKTLAWVACNKLSKIWNSDFNRDLKLQLF